MKIELTKRQIERLVDCLDWAIDSTSGKYEREELKEIQSKLTTEAT